MLTLSLMIMPLAGKVPGTIDGRNAACDAAHSASHRASELPSKSGCAGANNVLTTAPGAPNASPYACSCGREVYNKTYLVESLHDANSRKQTALARPEYPIVLCTSLVPLSHRPRPGSVTLNTPNPDLESADHETMQPTSHHPSTLPSNSFSQNKISPSSQASSFANPPPSH